MKLLRLGCLFTLLVSFLFLAPTILSAEAKESSKVEITLKEGKKAIDDKDKDNIYTPKPAEIVRILPTTGEVITSFIYIIIGLSLLVFIFGMLIVRMINNDVRWEY